MANRPYFLQYDIPEEVMLDTMGNPRWRFNRAGNMVIMTQPVIPNPSDDLWRAGCVRITFSCWLMMERNQHRVYPIMNRMSEANVRWYAVPFDASAQGQLRSMAMLNIQRELAERLQSARETRDAAEARLADESDSDYAARRRRYIAAARSIERRVTEMISRVSHAAAEFDITEQELRAYEAVGEVELLAGNMRARAQGFAAAHGIATRAGKITEARALRNGEMPPTIFADLLEDIANEQSGEEAEATVNAANSLRASFGDFFS